MYFINFFYDKKANMCALHLWENREKFYTALKFGKNAHTKHHQIDQNHPKLSIFFIDLLQITNLSVVKDLLLNSFVLINTTLNSYSKVPPPPRTDVLSKIPKPSRRSLEGGFKKIFLRTGDFFLLSIFFFIYVCVI